MRFQSLLAAVFTIACINSSFAQERSPWATDVSSAFQIAAQQNRPVLLHFWSRTCRPCRDLETYVFPNPGFAQAVAATCVPVKVNTTESAALANRYGVTRIPTDIIVTPRGEEIMRTSSPSSVEGYRALMRQVANQSSFQRQPELQQVAQVARQQNNSWANNTQPANHSEFNRGGGAYPPSGGSFHPSNGGFQPAAGNNDSNSGGQSNWNAGGNNHDVTNYGGAASGYGGAAPGLSAGPPNNAGKQPNWQSQAQDRPAAQVVDNQFAASRNSGNQPSATRQQNPPLGMEGYCPVTMMERKEWKKGDVRWGIRHRGRTYLFAGQEEMKRFWEDPDAYSPVLSGYDPVLSIDKNRWEDGKRQFGVFYRNPVTQRQHIYLFSDESTLKRFEANPGNYARVVHQAMMDNVVGRRQPQR